MKLIGILSDTHSYWDVRFAEHFKDCDEVWHAGDIGNPGVLDRLTAIVPEVRSVYGNIDGGQLRINLKPLEIFEVEGVRVMLTHIGGYPGKYAPGIRDRIELYRPKIMVCGHSHILRVIPDRRLGCVTINPGAAGTQGWQRVRTLLRLTLDAGTIAGCQVVELAPDPNHEYGSILY